MTNATQPTNRETILADLDKDMAKLGQESVNIARPKLAITLVKAAYNGDIDEDDVEARYDAYLAGREKAQGKSPLSQGVDDGNGKKANMSKCRQLVKMGMLPDIDGPELIDRTVALRGNMLGGDDKIKAPFDAFVDVSRAQIAQPDEPLSDDAIMSCIRKAESKDKSEVEKLIAAYKAARKLHDAIPLAGVEQAIEGYKDAIVEAGGEVPPITKEEKAHAEFLRKADAMGFTQGPLMIAAE